MVITKIVTINGREFTYNYSDAGRYVVRDGIEYEEAYDPIGMNRTYTEGRLIEVVNNPEDISEEQFAEAGRIMMGYVDNG